MYMMYHLNDYPTWGLLYRYYRSQPADTAFLTMVKYPNQPHYAMQKPYITQGKREAFFLLFTKPHRNWPICCAKIVLTF